MNFLLAMFSYYVTNSSLQTVYKEYIDVEKKENISGLFWFPQLLELEIAKKKQQLELNEAFAAKANGPALDEHMGEYVKTVLSKP
jgi:hypothetical protein